MSDHPGGEVVFLNLNLALNLNLWAVWGRGRLRLRGKGINTDNSESKSGPGENSIDYWLNRKNCCVPTMGFVTVFRPLTTTGAGEFVVQIADGPRFVVDCSVKPMAFVVQLKIRFAPEGMIASCGSNERLNTVPVPELSA